MTIDELTEKVIGCAYAVHNELGSGFLEKVYENALRIELVGAGLDVKQQFPVSVKYKEVLVGDYYADLIVDDRLIIELKALQNITKEHNVQLVNYLTATGIDNGLLINFGSLVEIRRKYRTYNKIHD